MVKRKRDRSASKTPEIQWELLLANDDQPAPPKRGGAPKLTRQPDPGDAPVSHDVGAQGSDKQTSLPNLQGESGRKSREPVPSKTGTSSGSKAPVLAADTAAATGTGPDPGINTEQALRLERDAWRLLVGMLGSMRGDPKVEELLAERHPELKRVAEACGAGTKKPPSRGLAPITSTNLDKARESSREWFARGLRGSNRHGAAEKSKMIVDLTATLKAHAASLLAEGDVDQRRLERLLEDGPASEEGPFVCALLAQELVGSRYENLFISRQGPGRYILGDDHEGSNLPNIDQDGARIHPRVCVVVKSSKGSLLIDGFYHEGEEDFLNPARVPIGPFLTVYFEGLPLKEALTRWKNGSTKNGSIPTKEKEVFDAQADQTVSFQSAVVQGIQPPAMPVVYAEPPREAPLPPGWEKRESRSKKGVFYYAHPAKGLSQMERPL